MKINQNNFAVKYLVKKEFKYDICKKIYHRNGDVGSSYRKHDCRR